MNKINFASTNVQNLNPEMKKRLENQDNFTAIDKDKLKQDTVEVTKSAVKENFAYRILRNVFGVEDPKKCLNSIALTLLTTIGVAALGNRSLKFMANLGKNLDSALLKEGSLYSKFSNGLNSAKEILGKNLRKIKVFDDIAQTLKTKKAKPRIALAKGTGQGFSTQFSYTVGDVAHASPFKGIFEQLQKSGLSKNKAEEMLKNALLGDFSQVPEGFVDGIKKQSSNFDSALKNLIGDGLNDEKNFEYFKNAFIQMSQDIKIGDKTVKIEAKEFANDLLTAIKNKHGKSPEELQDFLFKLKEGKAEGCEFFTEIPMNREGFVGGWWPSEFIRKAGQKIGIFKEKNTLGKGNMGDALIKYAIASGQLAQTAPAKLLQASVMIPAESISNYVCDHAGMNAFMLSSLYTLFNTAQDAPKGQKASTVADDFIGTIGNIAISTPVAFGVTYGLASLRDLKGNNIGSKILRPIGKFFGMGLNKFDDMGKLVEGTSNPVIKFAGGALRFIMIMFVISPIVQKPIRALIHKVFGKPYDPSELEKQAKAEAEANKIIPELGISQKQLNEKIMANPNALQEIQTNPQLAQKLQQNPKLLVDFLDGKDILSTNSQQQTTSKVAMSPANKALLDSQKDLFGKKTPQPTNDNNQTSVTLDTATYIPSSQFGAVTTSLNPEQLAKYNKAMVDSDKALKAAEKYF